MSKRSSQHCLQQTIVATTNWKRSVQSKECLDSTHDALALVEDSVAVVRVEGVATVVSLVVEAVVVFLRLLATEIAVLVEGDVLFEDVLADAVLFVEEDVLAALLVFAGYFKEQNACASGTAARGASSA